MQCVIPNCTNSRVKYEAYCSEICKNRDHGMFYCTKNNLFLVNGQYGPPWSSAVEFGGSNTIDIPENIANSELNLDALLAAESERSISPFPQLQRRKHNEQTNGVASSSSSKKMRSEHRSSTTGTPNRSAIHNLNANMKSSSNLFPFDSPPTVTPSAPSPPISPKPRLADPDPDNWFMNGSNEKYMPPPKSKQLKLTQLFKRTDT